MLENILDKYIFNSPSKGQLSILGVVEEIINFLNENPKSNYKITIGTDSPSGVTVDFVTAIIIHRVGRGGRYFWKRWPSAPVNSIRDKIYKEVNYSLEVTVSLIEQLSEALKKIAQPIHYSLEIHIDVGEHGATKVMVKEVVGVVRANGFEAKIKPESYAASTVADRYT